MATAPLLIHVRHMMGRKLDEWHQAPVARVKQETIDHLKVYDGMLFKLKPTTILPAHMQEDKVFILLIGGSRYLVNTEGYEYSRYVTRIQVRE